MNSKIRNIFQIHKIAEKPPKYSENCQIFHLHSPKAMNSKIKNDRKRYLLMLNFMMRTPKNCHKLVCIIKTAKINVNTHSPKAMNSKIKNIFQIHKIAEKPPKYS